MERIERLSAILIQLQSKRIVRASEIAERFEVSLRTVYRDIRSLEESGVPIGAEAGVGYYLTDNYTLPPVMFTRDEATALLFGEKLIEKLSDTKIKNEFCSALYKIKAILKPEEKDRLEKLHNQIAVLSWNSATDKSHQLYLFEIQQALITKQVLEIVYCAANVDSASTRQIEPIGLCNYSSRWHLFAWCRLRNEYRDFRLDRVQSLRVTSESFKNKQHITIEEYLKQSSQISDVANISLRIATNRMQYIAESKYWYGFISDEKIDENFTRVHFSNNELRGFAIWILNTGSFAKVEKPQELKAILDIYIKEFIENYG